MANEFAIGVTLAGDRRTVRLDVTVDGKSVVEHDCDASELEEMIELLGRARAGLTDAVPEMPAPGTRVRTLSAPTIAVQDLPGSKDQLLLARDPQTGWIGFRLAPKLATDLGKMLLKFD